MKILHVGKFFDPIPGGIEAVNSFIINSLPDDDHFIVSFNDKNRHEELHRHRFSLVRGAVPFTFMHQPLSFDYAVNLRKAIRHFSPDVVYLHYPNPFAAVTLLPLLPSHTPLVVHWHSDIVAQRRIYPIVRNLEHRLLKRADLVVATSPSYVEGSDALRPFADKIRVIPCAISTQQFELSENEKSKVEEIKARYGKPIIFFVGRHVTYKGLQLLLEAKQFIEADCELVIGGSGELTGTLRERYQTPGITWVGRLSAEELKCHYYAATVLAFPSITKNEAFGVVLAESMYCGCPNVTFEIPGSGVNWVSPDGQTSLMAPNSDVQSFAHHLDNIIQDSQLRDFLGGNARHRVREMFSDQPVAKLYRGMFDEIKTIRR